jgi:heme-degrading monooxygenase HmoA
MLCKTEAAMQPNTVKILGLLAVLALSNGSRAADMLPLSGSGRSDGTSFTEQLRAAPSGQVVMLNTFLVPDGDEDAFRQGWDRVAQVLRRQPGFVSATLHRPVGDSGLWVNYAIWDSASALAAALASPDFREAAAPMKQTGFRRLYQAMPAIEPIR